MAGPAAADELPVQLIDAGGPPAGLPMTDGELLLHLGHSMEAARSATSPDAALVGLVDLVSGLVAADAVTLELPGPSSGHAPRVLVHRGLLADETSAGAHAIWASTGLLRFDHRLTVEIPVEDARPGVLSLWRVDRPFAQEDQARARLAGTAIAGQVEQFLRRAKLAQRDAWMGAAEEVSHALLSQRTTPAVLQITVDRVRAVSACDLVWLVTGSLAEPVLQVVSGLSPTDPAAVRAGRLGPSLIDEVFRTGEPVRVADVGPAGPLGLAPGPAYLAGLGPAVGQPVRIEDRVVGALGLAWSSGRVPDFLALDPELPGYFARSAALVLRVRRARADAERVAVFEERDRIRLDLHDRVVQRLYALGLAIETSRRHQDRDQVDRQLDLVAGRIDETIAEVRRTITGLSVVAGGMDLYDALVGVVDAAADGAAFRAELRVVGLTQVPLDGRLADDLVAVLQEALSNVHRHARASRCRATLAVDGQVELVVEDDGVGIPAGVVGSGLANMRQRATSHGGELTLTDLAPGARLTWSVPHAKPAEQAEVERTAG